MNRAKENARALIFLLLFSVLTVFLLAAQVQHAEAKGIEDNVLKNPAGVDELAVNISQYGTIATDGSPTRITINFSIPQDDDRQDVAMDVKKIMDELGTETGLIEQANPGNSFSYRVSGVVRSRASHLTSIPTSYVIPNDVKIYMQPTVHIQSSDQRIRTLAEEVAKDSKDDFEKVAKLALWVHDHLNYDLSYSGKNLDALAVLSGRRGVCAEYTTLFIALARSIGIPAKFVSGYSYGELGWERHAYAEAYLGKWVPVDPLWLEIGYLDATHLKFGNHVDNYVRNNVEVTGYNVNRIDWVEDDVSLSTVSFSPIVREDYELAVSSDGFRKGDYGIVSLSIVPKEFIVGRLILQPCTGDYAVVDVLDKEKKVIFRPGEKEQVYWKIRINPDLPKNLLFTCPLTLNSRSLTLKTVDAMVNTQYSARSGQKLSARLSSDVVELGDEQKVYVSAAGLGGSAKIGLLAGNEKEEFAAGPDFQTVFSFEPKGTGDKEVVVYTSEGEVLTLPFTVKADLRIFMENVTVPEYLKAGESKNVSAYVVNKGAAEESVRLNIKVDGADNFANFMVKNRYFVSLPVAFASAGSKTIRFEISAAGLNLSETRVVEVYEEPAIYYDTDYADGKALLKLDVKKSKIKNVTVKIGDKEKAIDEVFGKKDVDFSLAPGAYALEISCYDVVGNPHKTTATIEFREKNFFEKLLEALNAFVKTITSLFHEVKVEANIVK